MGGARNLHFWRGIAMLAVSLAIPARTAVAGACNTEQRPDHNRLLEKSIMANSHYSADSAPLPPLSLRPGLPGSRKEYPVKIARFPALPVDDALPRPAPYVLTCDASIYVGESVHLGRRLPAHAISAEPRLSGPSPTTTTSID
jgi:hypothetical protein